MLLQEQLYRGDSIDSRSSPYENVQIRQSSEAARNHEYATANDNENPQKLLGNRSDYVISHFAEEKHSYEDVIVKTRSHHEYTELDQTKRGKNDNTTYQNLIN